MPSVLRTLLVSDLVSSTKLIEQLGDERAFALFARHDRMARDLLAEHDGREIDKTHGFLLLFERPVFIHAEGFSLTPSSVSPLLLCLSVVSGSRRLE